MKAIPFEQRAEDDPACVCVIDADEHRWSRADVLRAAMGFAQEFGRHGLVPGDAVAIIAPNCMEYVAAYLAAVYAGLYFVPVNRHLTFAEISHVLDDSCASLVLAHSSIRNLQSNLPRFVFGSTLDGRQISAWPTIRAAVPGSAMLYTSATTGRPKGVRRPGYDTLEALQKVGAFHASLGINDGPDEVHLCAGPLYHSAPLDNTWVALNRGQQIVLMGKWDAEECLRKIDTYRVSTTFMVPTMFNRLLRLPPAVRDKYDHGSLKVVAHGGAPCPRHVKRDILRWWGPVVFETYGSSEAVGTFVTPTDWEARPGTVGKPMPGSDILILNENGTVLDRGVPGRVYIKPFATCGFEYFHDPAKTKACRHGEYVYVGDIGYLDTDGYLFLCDRHVDMIITGGVNVYSAEVEQFLSMHEAVLDCAVLGEPDDDLGEKVVAFIELTPGRRHDAGLEASILDFLRSGLAPYKAPRVLRIVEGLPRDPNGKLLKRCLRESMNGRSG